MVKRTTNASKPADARTSSSVILYTIGIHPNRELGSSGNLEAADLSLRRAAYKSRHFGLRAYFRTDTYQLLIQCP